MQYLLVITLLVAPTYAIRFELFGLPTNVLMVWVFVAWFVFALWLFARHKFANLFHWLRSELVTWHGILAAVFFLVGVISLFVGGFSEEKLGQFLVLFFQPVGTFILLRYLSSIENWKSASSADQPKRLVGNVLTHTALLFVSVAGLYAIVQYFTLIGVPVAWWGNSEEPKRAVAFFMHPNFYALFITPLLAFLLPIVSGQWLKQARQVHSGPSPREQRLREITEKHCDAPGVSKTSSNSSSRGGGQGLLTTSALLLGAVGLLLSLSRGGWLGLAAAIGAYILITGNRTLLKRAAALFAISLIVVLAVPNFRYRILLPFRGEKSTVARFSLWNTGWKMVTDSPVLGKGLLGFSNNWYAYNTDSGLQHYPAPHNIVLNFWIDTGLLGLISFFCLLVLAAVRSLKDRDNVYKLGLLLACIALVVHGLVDIPYFKNDLALLFWMLYSFI